jgi:hypothetical protein
MQGLTSPSIFQHVRTEMRDSAVQRSAVADWPDLLRHTSHSVRSRYSLIIITTHPRLFLQRSLSLRHYNFTCLAGSLDSSICIMTRLRGWPGRPRNRGSIPGEGNKLTCFPKHPKILHVPPSTPQFNGQRKDSPGGLKRSWREAKHSTCPVPRLTKSGVISPFPHTPSRRS